MAENLTASTLKNLVEKGVFDKFAEFAKNADEMDYETMSFMLQLGCKVSIIPGGMEKFKKSQLIELGFGNILQRKFVLLNNKRFAGSDSTNAL